MRILLEIIFDAFVKKMEYMPKIFLFVGFFIAPRCSILGSNTVDLIRCRVLRSRDVRSSDFRLPVHTAAVAQNLGSKIHKEIWIESLPF